MTPQELGRALAAEMHNHAKSSRAQAADYTRDADNHQKKADGARRNAVQLTLMAAGWEQTADKLASGAITLGDAQTLAVLRDGLSGAREAIDPRASFAQQREQLAADATQSLPVFGAPDILGLTPLATAFGNVPSQPPVGAWDDPADAERGAES